MFTECIKQIRVYQIGQKKELFHFSCYPCINRGQCNIKPHQKNICPIESFLENVFCDTIFKKEENMFITNITLKLHGKENWKKFKDIKRCLNDSFHSQKVA